MVGMLAGLAWAPFIDKMDHFKTIKTFVLVTIISALVEISSIFSGNFY